MNILKTGPPELLEDTGDLLCSIFLLSLICYGLAGEIGTTQSQPSLWQPFTSTEESRVMTKTVSNSPPSYHLLI